MSIDPFIGEIIMFGGNYAPRGWALCDGQHLSTSEHSALFSILGATYGGDGRTTFGLPDMRGRVPLHAGHGPGLSAYNLGQSHGEEHVTLNVIQIPAHSHQPRASDVQADKQLPGGSVMADDGNEVPIYSNSPNTKMMETTKTGGGQPHNNIQPYQAVNFIIALEGMYPSRN